MCLVSVAHQISCFTNLVLYCKRPSIAAVVATAVKLNFPVAANHWFPLFSQKIK